MKKGANEISDEKPEDDDTTNKDYLTEDEALSFGQLTDVMNVVSMRQSILTIKGNSFFLLTLTDVMNVVSMRQSILRIIGNSFFLLILTDVMNVVSMRQSILRIIGNSFFPCAKV